MTNKARNGAGKFAPKSEMPRKVRSVNLTDDAWQWLATTAEAAGMSRNDYLEALARGDNPFMETVEPFARDLPEAADLLNQLKAKRKKSAVTLADIDLILEIIEQL